MYVDMKKKKKKKPLNIYGHILVLIYILVKPAKNKGKKMVTEV